MDSKSIERLEDGYERYESEAIVSKDLKRLPLDQDAVSKPYAIFDGPKWLLWYNGRRGSVEQIGLARQEGEGLGF